MTQDLKFDRPIVHNRYDFDSLIFWIFEIRYLRDYWKLWTPVTHALGSHAETLISGPEEWKHTSEKDSTYLKNKLRFGSPIGKLSWTKDNVGLCPKYSHLSSKHLVGLLHQSILAKPGSLSLLRLATYHLVSGCEFRNCSNASARTSLLRVRREDCNGLIGKLFASSRETMPL